ncbi:MAG: TrmH family RNA methyltransferase [Acidimicrobiia bacterium]
MEHPVDIESPANPRVKSWLALSKRSERDRTERFVIEGHREATRAGNLLTILETVICPEYAGGSPDLPKVVTVNTRVFDKLSHRQRPDGVLVIAQQPNVALANFAPPDPALILVADGIEKPGNIGAILRSCDAMGAGFIGASLGTDITNPNVVRSAQGSLFSTPIAVTNREAAMEWCTEHTSIIVAHTSTTAASLWDLDLTSPTSIVIGSEHEGVDATWLDVGIAAMVPMQGAADSLNASVAAGIFTAEATRQRRGSA